MAGGFNRNRKEMTKRELQEQVGDQASNAIKMVQGLATVVSQQIRNIKLETSNLSAMSIMKEGNQPITDKSVAYVDFIGTVDGQPFEGGEGIGVFIDMEVHQFLPDFQKGLLGLTADSLTSFDVKFPEAYQEKSLAGKTAVFEVFVRKVFNEIQSPVALKAMVIQKEREAKRAAERAEQAAKSEQGQATQEA